MYTLIDGFAIEQTADGIRVTGTHEHEFTGDGKATFVIPRCSRGRSAEDCLADANEENERARLALGKMSLTGRRIDHSSPA
jgi:hypothetical protein